MHEKMLQRLFAGALLFRFVYVFITSPMHELFSDPARHWENAQHFWAPYLFGSIDPLAYQAYLAFVQFITRENASGVAFCTGLLSAIMPWLWYKALREILPRAWALMGGIAIALMPSLIMIYSYFMNETLLLDLLAAAVWLSFRAMRRQTLGAFAWALALWSLASYTRMVALPLALGTLALIVYDNPRCLLPKAAIAALAFGALLPPACWHSQVHLNFCAPFGLPYINEIYRISQKHTITMNVRGKGNWGFGSPNYYHPPLEPFTSWTTPRTGEVHIEIDPAHGRSDWDMELERVSRESKPFSAFQDWAENALYLLFDPSWPDNNSHYWMGWLAIQSRWLVFPALFLVASQTAHYGRRMPRKKLLLPGLALLLFLLLLGQRSFIIEGRYRKPLEPLLIASCIILLHERRRHKLLAASCGKSGICIG